MNQPAYPDNSFHNAVVQQHINADAECSGEGCMMHEEHLVKECVLSGVLMSLGIILGLSSGMCVIGFLYTILTKVEM